MKKGKNILDDKIVNIVIFRNMKINIHGYLFIFLKDSAKSVLVDSYQFNLVIDYGNITKPTILAFLRCIPACQTCDFAPKRKAKIVGLVIFPGPPMHN